MDQVIELMRERITSGTWPTGFQLPVEADLAASFGVGRNTVREAVRALAHVGMLDVTQGRGTFVKSSDELAAAIGRSLTGTVLRDILEVRRGLEAEAAALAATRRTARELQRIVAAWEAQRAARDSQDHDATIVADIEFHVAIAEASHNQLLLALYRQLITSVRDSVHTLNRRNLVRPLKAQQRQAGLERERVSRLWHQGITEAIRDRDAERARNLTLQYIPASQVTVGRDELVEPSA